MLLTYVYLAKEGKGDVWCAREGPVVNKRFVIKANKRNMVK